MLTDTETTTGHALNEEGKAALAKGEQRFARETFLRGAHLGHPGAQYNLGTMCFSGEGGCRDYLEAARWFRKAADQGHVKAQSNLAGMYALGLGVTEDPGKALELMLHAANAGDSGAQFNLGNLYAAGDGVAEDLVEAYKWLALAAASGLAEAQVLLLQIGVLLSPEGRTEAHRRVREFRKRSQ